MNYNFCNNLNPVQFLQIKPQSKLSQGQILLLLISTALKQSLAVYQLQWKTAENVPKASNLSQHSSGTVYSSYLPEKKKSQEHLNLVQQNKKSIQKISYNQKFLKNDKIQTENRQNLVYLQDKNCSQQHRLTAISNQYPKIKRQKIISQCQSNSLTSNKLNSSMQNRSLIDLYQGAYLPKKQLSAEEIQQKRQKLLLRRVLNWKEIDKKVGFRKMELKKLLS